MGIVYVLLPLSLLLAGGGLVAYIWALRRGQFEDLDTPAKRILWDNDEEKGEPPGTGERAGDEQ